MSLTFAKFYIFNLTSKAVHPDKFLQSLKNIYEILGEDGVVLFRDYAVNDHAMVRFKPGSKVIWNTPVFFHNKI